MSGQIDGLGAESGRMLEENSTVINVANVIADVYDAENHVIKTSASIDASGMQVTVDNGTAGTGITIPTGGTGLIGWASGIFNRLAGVVLAAGSAVIGKVGIQVGGADIAAGNPVPVSLPTGQTVGLAAGSAAIGTVSIASAQTVGLVAGSAVVGKVGVQVGGSDVSASVPVPITPGTSVKFAQTTADGDNVTMGAKTDAAASNYASTSSIVSLLKAIGTSIGSIVSGLGAVVIAAGSAVIGKVGLQVSAADVSLSNPIPTFRAGSWVVTGDSSANTAQTITQAAQTGKTHYIFGFEVVIKGAAAGADIDVKLYDGTTLIYHTVIGNAAAVGTNVGMYLSAPITLTTGNKCDLIIGAGGASVITCGNLVGRTV